MDRTTDELITQINNERPEFEDWDVEEFIHDECHDANYERAGAVTADMGRKMHMTRGEVMLFTVWVIKIGPVPLDGLDDFAEGIKDSLVILSGKRVA
jgi:hypothetical protein